MFRFVVIVCILLIPVLAFLFSDRCSGNVFPQTDVYVETEDMAFAEARELALAGRESEAMSAFWDIIRKHPDSAAESNFEVGLLAFNKGDYPLAIYHLNQFLVLRPDISKQTRDRVNGLLSSAEKLFLQKILPGRQIAEPTTAGLSPVLEQKYRDVMRENERLKSEIATLRQRLATAGTSLDSDLTPAVAVPAEPVVAVATPPPPVVAEPPKPEVPATHTVVAGDTLSGISKKYYGTSARWREIYEANRVSMSSPSALKIGMVLKLPRP